jgi:SAM-dependent methyltransferase
MKPSRFHSNRKLHNWLVYYYRDRFLQKYAPLYKGKLYDLGCGEAPFRNFFQQHADDYIGVDWAGSLHDTKADIAADLNALLPIEDAQADTVISISVLEHLREPQTMLNEAFRILKPGGHIILQSPWQWMVHEAPCDYFRYSPYGLEYMFTKAGFTDLKIEAECGFFAMWFLKICYFLRRFVRGPKALQFLIKVALAPFWMLFQSLGLILDKLDNNPALESGGYYITGKKP